MLGDCLDELVGCGIVDIGGVCVRGASESGRGEAKNEDDGKDEGTNFGWNFHNNLLSDVGKITVLKVQA